MSSTGSAIAAVTHVTPTLTSMSTSVGLMYDDFFATISDAVKSMYLAQQGDDDVTFSAYGVTFVGEDIISAAGTFAINYALTTAQTAVQSGLQNVSNYYDFLESVYSL